MLLKQLHILGTVRKGQLDDVGMLGDEGQILQVLRRQGRQPKVALGQVDSLVASERFAATRARVIRTRTSVRSTCSITPPILPSSNQIDSPDRTSSNTSGMVQPIDGGGQDLSHTVAGGRAAGFEVSLQDEQVPLPETDGILAGG